MIHFKKRITKVLTRLREFAGWSAPGLFANLKDRFSCFEVHIQCNQSCGQLCLVKTRACLKVYAQLSSGAKGFSAFGFAERSGSVGPFGRALDCGSKDC